MIVLADRRKGLQQLVSEAKKFSARLQQVAELQERLETMVCVRKLFREQNVGHPAIPAAAQATTAVKEAQLAFAANPKDALDGFSDLVKRAGAFVDRYERSIKETWTDYVRGKARNDNEDLLAVLEKIPDFKSTVKTVRTLRAELQAKADVVPANEAALSDFHEKLAAIATAWETLGSDAVPTVVIDFLRKAVSTDGARLDLLLDDPTIAKWLKDKKLMPAFRIRLA